MSKVGFTQDPENVLIAMRKAGPESDVSEQDAALLVVCYLDLHTPFAVNAESLAAGLLMYCLRPVGLDRAKQLVHVLSEHDFVERDHDPA